jgi:hypothetical protein
MRHGLCPVDINSHDKACPAKAALIGLRQLLNRAARNLEAGLEPSGLAPHREGAAVYKALDAQSELSARHTPPAGARR